MPSYSVSVCFYQGICPLSPPEPDLIEGHVNASLYWILSLNFFGNLFFVTCIYKLRNIRSEFNIRNELMLTFASWFVCTQVTLGLFIWRPNSS